MQDLRLTAMLLVVQARQGHLVKMWDRPESYCEAIGCKEIEVIPSKIDGILLVIDGEGKLNGKRHNELATELYKYGHADPIVGNAVVIAKDKHGRGFRSLNKGDTIKIVRVLKGVRKGG